MAKELKPKLNTATGDWEALEFGFVHETTAQAFIDAQDKRWFRRASRSRMPSRRALRATLRADGRLKPHRRSHHSGAASRVVPGRDFKSLKAGRLRKELQP